MKRNNIDKFSIGYWFLKRIIVTPAFYLFYRRVEITGKENLPENSPFIIGANHQNALMDALAMLITNKFQPVFVSRADIYKKPLIAKILTFMKMMPIFRIRDGAEALKKNDEIFEQAVTILRRKRNPFAIMPEGNHGDKRKLRPLVKGIFRISLKAQEAYKNKKGVKIVPVGIDYSNYFNFQADLLVIYGKPIEIADYWQEYQKEPVAAINKLRTRLADEMKKVMIHIENDTYYDMIMSLRPMYNNKMRQKLNITGHSLYDQFKADKILIDCINERIYLDENEVFTLKNYLDEYTKELNYYGLKDWAFKRKLNPKIKIYLAYLALLPLLPIFIFGVIHNFIPFKIPSLPTKNIKDQQFHSSVKFVLGIIAFLIFYTVYAVLVFNLLPTIQAVTYLFLAGFSGMFSFRYTKWFKKLSTLLKKHKLRKQDPEKYYYLKDLRNKILRYTDKIINETDYKEKLKDYK